MDHSQTNTSPPTRGTVVVDTCVLLFLAGRGTRTHTDQKVSKDSNYLHILSFLADNGYKIIIPDMVAYEAANYLPGYGAINKLYDQRQGFNIPALQSFIKSVGNGYVNNISIERSPKKDSEISQEIEHSVLQMIECAKELTGSKKTKDSFVTASRAIITQRFASFKKNLKEKQGRDPGDEVIMEFCEAYNQQAHPSPSTIVLSEDRELLDKIRNLPPPNRTTRLNIKGLLNALEYNKLLVAADKETTTKAESIYNKLTSANDKCLPYNEEAKIDDDGNSMIRTFSFSNSLKQLAEDIKKRPAAEKSEESPKPYSSGRAEAFSSKFEKYSFQIAGSKQPTQVR